MKRYYEEMWNRWDYNLADQILAPDFVFRGSLGRDVQGRESFKSYMRLVQGAFSDFHNQIEEIVACEHKITVRLSYTGTHDGMLFGIAPSHRRIKYPGLAVFEECHGQFRTGFVVGDRLTLLQQILGDSFWLGVTPKPAINCDGKGFRSATADDVCWCAQLMASSEPWMTLGRDLESSLTHVGDPQRELYVALADDQPAGDQRVGFVLIDMRGTFGGYVQTLGVAPQFRNRQHGARLLAFGEDRVFRESPNVFLCVSSFNKRAEQFYYRHSYEKVGEIPGFIIPGASEILLRKSIGPKSTFKPGAYAVPGS